MKLRESQRFVAHAQCRRLLRHQIVKRFLSLYENCCWCECRNGWQLFR